jgi:hypothetical protein
MSKLNEKTSFEFQNIDSQLLEIGLQTPPHQFFRNRFLETLLKTIFYKNSMYPNMFLVIVVHCTYMFVKRKHILRERNKCWN